MKLSIHTATMVNVAVSYKIINPTDAHYLYTSISLDAVSLHSRNVDDFFELIVIDHLADDVKATDELPIDDELRECWPIVYNLQTWKEIKHLLVLR